MPDPSPTPGTYVAPTVTITGTPQTGPAVVSVASASGASDASLFSNPWTWAAALAGLTLVVLARSKHPPRWVRRMGLHR